MLNQPLRCILGLAIALACASPAAAQSGPDPLTRFLDGVFKRNAAPPEPPAQAAPAEPEPEPARPSAQAPARERAAARTAAPKPQGAPPSQAAKPQGSKPVQAAAPRQVQPTPQPASKPEPQPVRQAVPEKSDSKPASVPAPKPVAEQPQPAPAEPPRAAPEPVRAARSTPAQAVAAPTSVVATPSPATPTAPPMPTTPAAAIERINTYFNSIDQLSAYFVQSSPNNQRAEGTLSVRRPGQLQFAYAPPSTLEIVSDGRNVAIRDKKLGTNDVYPIGQTPLKFLLQENVDLARDTKVRDVQVGRDGIITLRFDDSATLGGTSKITLRYDARTNALKQWTIVDAQGYETTVTLSDLNVVRRRDARAGN